MSDAVSVSREDLLALIDTEIASANEASRSDGFTTWAIAAATVGLGAVAGTIWETGGLRLPNVALLFVACSLGAHAVVDVLHLSWTRPRSIRTYILWSNPPLAAFVQRVAFAVLCYQLRSRVPAWAVTLSAIVFVVGALSYGASALLTARFFSLLRPFTVLTERTAAGRDRGIALGARFGKVNVLLVRPALYAAIAFAYGRAAFAIPQGSNIRDLRFALTSAMIMTLCGLAMRERAANRVEDFSTLRLSLALRETEVSLALPVFRAVVAGVPSAPKLFEVCRDLTLALKAAREEAQMLIAAIDHSTDSSPTASALAHTKFGQLERAALHARTMTTAIQVAHGNLRSQDEPSLQEVQWNLQTAYAEFIATRDILNRKTISLQRSRPNA